MRLPLWLTATKPRTSNDGMHAVIDVSLARCRNCGQIKIASNPCGFDHLAAILELNAGGPVDE